ncbi:MAG TPA: CpsB/CapC family capsule biosynthesis tyrosine phosphatase, partial [Thermoanaerobaculia bacterium]|nr:CpsB/CapC family capsule biosynthesis tyrosine phosphatase [Thermoanaerobaculia bacterium]
VIDLHCHILPGVDDGAVNLADAVAMCRLAAADGCTVMVATPHSRHSSFPNATREALAAAHEELVAALAASPAEERVEVRMGAEVRVDSELLADLERPGAEALSLAGSRYVLLEFPRAEVGPAPEEVVHELVVAGWRPVVAHPEVLPWLEVPRLGALVEAGAMLQVTASAVTSDFGRGPHQKVWELLDEGLVHFVASDSHSPTWRAPGLSKARALLARRLGSATARALVEDNPASVLADVPLPATATARQGGGA